MATRFPLSLGVLALVHMVLVIASNYLVQLPFELFGLHTTWGAFTFPLIFVATDLTVRVLGASTARRVVARVMLPALLASYGVSVLFQNGSFAGWAGLAEFNSFVFRIAFASFVAYVLGQLLDVTVFVRMRSSRRWWLAPMASTAVASVLDTAVFFSIAFYKSTDAFMAANWVEIAVVDCATKLLVSVVFSLPLYGVLLSALTRQSGNPTPSPSNP